MRNKTGIFLEKTARLAFIGLLAVLPLFFLSSSAIFFGMDGLAKSFLLWLVSPLLFLFLILNIIRSDKPVFYFSRLELPLLSFLFFFLLSAVFSLDPLASFFGNPNIMVLPFINLIFLLVLFYFVLNYLRSGHRPADIFYGLYASFFVIVWTLFAATMLEWLELLASDALFLRIINSSFGSFEDLAVYLSVMNIVFLALGFEFFKRSGFKAPLAQLTWIASLLLIIIINFLPAWWIMLAGASLLLFLKFHEKSEKTGKKFRFKDGKALVLFFFLAIIFIIFNYTISGQVSALKQRLAKNFQLDPGNSIVIVKKSLAAKPMSGQGAENFPYAFSLFRGPEMNSLPWWNTRFLKAGFFWGDLAVSLGLFGFLAYIWLVLTAVYLSLKICKTPESAREDIKERNFFQAAAIGFVLLSFSQLIYSQNIILLSLFFVFLATVTAEARNRGRVFWGMPEMLKPSFCLKGHKFVYPLFFMAALLLVALLGYGTKMFAAEICYRRALFESGDKKEKNLALAVKLNQGAAKYDIALSRFYKEKAVKALDKEDPEVSEIENFANNAIVSAKNAIIASPESVSAHETLGLVYRDLSDYSPDSLALAVQSLKNAHALEPSNPVIPAEIAKLYLKDKDLDKAEVYIKKAIGLKPGYRDAQLAQAEIQSQKGDYDKAVKTLLDLPGASADYEISYEIGRLYFNSGEYDEAEKMFRKVIGISPLHANALYSLALSLEKQERTKEALVYYRKVLGLNPGNEALKEKIEDME